MITLGFCFVFHFFFLIPTFSSHKIKPFHTCTDSHCNSLQPADFHLWPDPALKRSRPSWNLAPAAAASVRTQPPFCHPAPTGPVPAGGRDSADRCFCRSCCVRCHCFDLVGGPFSAGQCCCCCCRCHRDPAGRSVLRVMTAGYCVLWWYHMP